VATTDRYQSEPLELMNQDSIQNISIGLSADSEFLRYAIPYKEYIVDLHHQIEKLEKKIDAKDRKIASCNDEVKQLEKSVIQCDSYVPFLMSPYGVAIVAIVTFAIFFIIARSRRINIRKGNFSVNLDRDDNVEPQKDEKPYDEKSKI